MCCCGGGRRRGMAVDVTRLNFVDGMYGLSLVAIACCACALVYMAALFTVAVPSSKVMRYGIEARVVPGADLDGFVGYRSVSTKVGTLTRCLQMLSVSGGVFSLLLWLYMACLRKYSVRNNFIKSTNIFLNTVTETSIIACVLVWFIGLNNPYFQSVYPLILCLIGGVISVPLIISWTLLLIPDIIQKWMPREEKIMIVA